MEASLWVLCHRNSQYPGRALKWRDMIHRSMGEKWEMSDIHGAPRFHFMDIDLDADQSG
jgi:hypothetical protein